MENYRKTLTTKLEVSRKELLDLGLRNSLINFRPTLRSLETADELSSEVFRTLVIEQKGMSFLSLPASTVASAAVQDANQVDFDFGELFGEASDESGLAGRHTDTKLQTKHTPDVLLRRLLKINTEAQSYVQEQGISVLYLALGFLEWYEAESAQTPRKAPLVLVPVSLSRGQAKENFKITYTGEDLEPNLSLAVKLTNDFGLKLPAFAADEFDIADYFREVEEAVASDAGTDSGADLGRTRWAVKPDEIHLGFFSFGKFRMYKDLEQESWPEDQNPLVHELLGALLGDGFPKSESGFLEGENLDKRIQPGELHFVKDADSTQAVAALEVMTGKNLVIQGPPGTGKSQTITNVIAECVGQGKTVLFVAEKMAALEVVKRRLDEVHIGDMVLELHSHKSNKKAVIEELSRTLHLGRLQVDDGVDDLRALRDCQKQLNDYCEQANAPILKSGVSFVAALGRCLQLKKRWKDLPRFDFGRMKDWSASDFQQRANLVEEVSKHIEENGPPEDNRFFASKRRSFSPAQQSDLNNALNTALDALENASGLAKVLANHMRFEKPLTLRACGALARGAKRVYEVFQLEGIAIKREEWRQQRDKVRTLIDTGQTLARIQRELADTFVDAAWKEDMLSIRRAYITRGGRWWRFLSGYYRRARKTLRGLCVSDLPGNDAVCLRVIDQLIEGQSRQEVYAADEALGAELFGDRWQKLDSDWNALEDASRWIFALYDEIDEGVVPESILGFLSGGLTREDLDETAADRLEIALAKTKAHIADIFKSLEAEAPDCGDLPIDVLAERLTEWRKHLDDMYQQVRYRQLQDELQANKLGFLIADMDGWRLSGAALNAAFKLGYYEGLVNEAYETSPALDRFDRGAHERRIDQFRTLDGQQLIHAQGRLAMQHFDSIPHLSGGGQIGIINREINKKRRHLPIRKLIEQAGLAILHFKPVLMMSPMSIAQYLAPSALRFDVVIFDEASQVKSVDAFGAILRGKQVVVVGDTQQMPPTDFFSRAYEGDADEDSVTGDIESILGLFLAKGASQSWLRWHYRSRHESLIAVSNHEFYENKLVVFPSSGTNPIASGLHFHHLPDTVYDRGKSSTNKEEARVVAEAVMVHAREHPDLTLGVVAFSTGQRDMITLQLEQLRREDESCEAFFADHSEEPFFIKNLENVQGDERAVIFISIGYGRDVNRRLGKNFGPLNREGGHRRFNVLISRAKQAMHVFSNFSADELQLTGGDGRGLRTLRHFLKYAETRELDIPVETGKAPDSPFEQEVIAALEEAGYETEPQVGAAGYYIDIAVRDLARPGKYLLAIECDGAMYHNSQSARDRDRLRQSVLEGLGWRFHRIWSTDWFRNPAAELSRAKQAIEEAKRQGIPQENKRRESERPQGLNRGTETTQSAELSINPYQATTVHRDGYYEIYEESPESLAKLICQVVDGESPVHVDVVTRRLQAAYGMRRSGKRVKEAVSAAVESGGKQGFFKVNGDFLYRPDQTVFHHRSRTGLDAVERKAKFVAPEEWCAAILEIVGYSIDVDRGDLILRASNKLGFNRITGATSDIVGKAIDGLVRRQQLTANDGKYRIPD